MSARQTALQVLIACRKDGAWSNGVLKQMITRDRLDRRDAALATRLCYGVLQNRGLLDHYLRQLLTGKLSSLQPVVRDILHMGLYQILMMDKIPESAAVNESVLLTKKFCPGQKGASGLVNGVLRNAVRRKDTLEQPKGYAELYSHPQKLVDLLKANVGKKLAGMLKANNEIPPTVVQVNTLQVTTGELMKLLEEEGVQAEEHSWMENCLVLSGTGNLEDLKSFQKGMFYVQDPASKLSVLCAELPQNSRVLDCCAAPGGKSFAAAMAMEGTGSITSCDVHPHKIQLIQKGAERLGIGSLQAMCQDATVFVPAWEAQMDGVLVDVPCSGYGIIRKKPDIRLKDPEEMATLPQLQLRILQNQARYVKKGGVLMYSTCTVLKRENEEVVERFLQENSEYLLEALPLPDHIQQTRPGMLTLIPGEYDTDGFFICRLRRKV